MNPKGNPQNLKMFSSTYQPPASRKGPKKSRLRKFLKEVDLGKNDIMLLAKLLLDMSRDEIAKIAADETKSIILVGAAMAMLKDMKAGKTDTIQWLSDRAFGQSTQHVESENRNRTIQELSPEERDEMLADMMKRYASERQHQSNGSEVRPDQDQVPGEGQSPD